MHLYLKAILSISSSCDSKLEQIRTSLRSNPSTDKSYFQSFEKMQHNDQKITKFGFLMKHFLEL